MIWTQVDPVCGKIIWCVRERAQLRRECPSYAVARTPVLGGARVLVAEL